LFIHKLVQHEKTNSWLLLARGAYGGT
jgi:hypothetical protein